MKHYYTLSRDYTKLKALLEKGHELAGFVDYRYIDAEPPFCRDIVAIRLQRDTFYFGVRGTGYGQVGPFESDLYKTCMDELFVKTCRVLNLEWIDGVSKDD